MQVRTIRSTRPPVQVDLVWARVWLVLVAAVAFAGTAIGQSSPPSPSGQEDRRPQAADAEASQADTDTPQTAPTELPNALPPLDDGLGLLLGDGAFIDLPEVRLLGHGRLRLEFDEGRRFRAADPPALGASFTGRAGVEVPVGEASARLVFGDGVRVGTPSPFIPLPLVARDLSSFLYEVSLNVDTEVFGFPVLARLGRVELEVGDGRWIGTTPFDPRGRTFDGVDVALSPQAFSLRAGAFARSTADAIAGTALAWLLLVDGGFDFDAFGLDAYAFAHRDFSTLTPVNVATAGARGRIGFAGLTAKAGADGQVGAIDLAPFSPALQAVHGEVDIEYAVESLDIAALGTPYAAFHLEGTYGSTIDGKGFRSPGGDVHRFLGALDLLDPSNVAEAAIHIGLRQETFALALSGRVFGVLDPTREVFDPVGRVIRGADGGDERWLMTEVDGSLSLQFAPGAFVEGEAAVGLPGPALDGLTRPAVRLMTWVRFDVDLGLQTTADSFTSDKSATESEESEEGEF